MKIFITGDYCPIGRIENYLLSEKYNEIIKDISKISNSADLSITNLEAPLTNSTDKLNKSGPNIKALKMGINPLKIAGFNLVALSNNHILDFKEKGIKDTMELCSDNQINYVGAGVNIEDARKPFVFIHENKKIGILNFAENEFCSATKSSAGANPVNLITNNYDIKKLKDEVDFLIIIAHGGREHYQLPTPNQRERYRFYVDSGADLVVGHHSHCFSGYENYNDKYIFYSLGNFIFDYKKKYQKGTWTEGYAVLFDVNLENKKVEFDLHPFQQGHAKKAILNLLTKQQKEVFLKKIFELNKLIINDSIFHKSWKQYLKTQKVIYKSDLFVKNTYLRALILKGFFPKFYWSSKSRKTNLLNLFRCETHREILINILSDETDS